MGKTLRKKDLVVKVAGRLRLSQGTVRQVLDAVLEEIGESLGEGNPVGLAGFGTFDLREYPARQGVHPRTGERMQYPERRAPSFRAGATLKRRVRGE